MNKIAFEKVASEVADAYHELALLKEAGEIDALEFLKEANRLSAAASKHLGKGSKARDVVSKAIDELKGAATGRDIKAAMPTPAKDRYLRDPATFKELDKTRLAKGIAKTLGVYGVPAAGVGYAASK